MWRMSARAQKFQVLAIRDFVFTDRKRWNGDGLSLKFVVPTKPVPPPATQRGCSLWYRDLGMNRNGTRTSEPVPNAHLPVGRQAVQDICKCLGMHQPMLNRNVKNLLCCSVQNLVKRTTNACVVLEDFVHRRPVGRRIVWQLPGGRIDPEREQLVKVCLEWGHAQFAPADQIPIECFQMAQVKDEPMAFRDWPLVQRVRPYHREQRISSSPGFCQLSNQTSRFLHCAAPLAYVRN